MFNRPPTHGNPDSPCRRARQACQACPEPVEGTDAVDAALIAEYGVRMRPSARHPPDPERNQLTALIVRRRQLVAMTVTERQRADPDHLDRTIADDIAHHLRFLQERLDDIEQRIAALIAGHPLWSSLSKSLQAIKGVGPQTATALITQMLELGTIGRCQIAALAPVNRDSGSSRGRRFVQGGRTTLKTALYLAALSAARFNPTLRGVHWFNHDSLFGPIGHIPPAEAEASY